MVGFQGLNSYKHSLRLIDLAVSKEYVQYADASALLSRPILKADMS